MTNELIRFMEPLVASHTSPHHGAWMDAWILQPMRWCYLVATLGEGDDVPCVPWTVAAACWAIANSSGVTNQARLGRNHQPYACPWPKETNLGACEPWAPPSSPRWGAGRPQQPRWRTDWPAAPMDDGPRGGQVGDQQGVVEWMVSQARGRDGFRYLLWSVRVLAIWEALRCCFPAMFDGLYLHTIIKKQNIYSPSVSFYYNAFTLLRLEPYNLQTI